MEYIETIELTKIVGGGQAIGTLKNGQKCFVWGGLPGENVEVRLTKKKSKLSEAIVERVISPSPDRIDPHDPESYLSTSPWQIMSFAAEQLYKSQLVAEAFELHGVTLPNQPEIYSDHTEYGYRNKIEFSWYGSIGNGDWKLENGEQEDAKQPILNSTNAIGGGQKSTIQNLESTLEKLDLAFFKRGSRGKVQVDGTSLARPEINKLAREIRDLLRTKPITARNLKTLIIRCDQRGSCVWQLYLKDEIQDLVSETEANKLPAQGGEIIFSNPKSPASVITKRLAAFGDITLTDTLLDVPFRYSAESFFQINLPIYQRTLGDIAKWIDNREVVDMYSGVGTIGLTIGGEKVTLVEINEYAVREMRRNIDDLDKKASAILAASESALDYITPDKTIIVDPPRAGLHTNVVDQLLEVLPPRIIYLSCNPVTQARDIAKLLDKYQIAHHTGYNFFPRTPHIEHLVVLDLAE